MVHLHDGPAVQCTSDEWYAALEIARREIARRNGTLELEDAEVTDLLARAAPDPMPASVLAEFIGNPVVCGGSEGDADEREPWIVLRNGSYLVSIEIVGDGLLRVREVGRFIGGEIMPNLTTGNKDGRIVPSIVVEKGANHAA
jgi:hypothetical protein